MGPRDEEPPSPDSGVDPSHWYVIFTSFYSGYLYNSQRAACADNNPLAALHP